MDGVEDEEDMLVTGITTRNRSLAPSMASDNSQAPSMTSQNYSRNEHKEPLLANKPQEKEIAVRPKNNETAKRNPPRNRKKPARYMDYTDHELSSDEYADCVTSVVDCVNVISDIPLTYRQAIASH